MPRLKAWWFQGPFNIDNDVSKAALIYFDTVIVGGPYVCPENIGEGVFEKKLKLLQDEAILENLSARMETHDPDLVKNWGTRS